MFARRIVRPGSHVGWAANDLYNIPGHLSTWSVGGWSLTSIISIPSRIRSQIRYLAPRRIRSISSSHVHGFFDSPNYTGTTTPFLKQRLRSRPLRHLPRPSTSRGPRPCSGEDQQPVFSPDQKHIPVTAIHMAQTIELQPLLSSVLLLEQQRYSTKTQLLRKSSIVVRLSSSSKNDAASDVDKKEDDALRYVAIYRFGSMVFFNVDQSDMDRMVHSVKQYATEPAAVGSERLEKFDVFVVPEFCNTTTPAVAGEVDEQSSSSASGGGEPPEAITGDYCIVPELDMNGVAVIGNIMAQTVALDSYNDRVDELLTKFASINSTVTKTGSFSAADKTFLFKTVAQNNGIFIDMISKIRIKDRSDTAWNLTKYETIHYGLKEEFEIDDRFEHIEFKLNLIQQNAKFFLQVLQHQKSNNLEWIIVVLILAECILMCVEMSGLGEPLFQGLAAASSLGYLLTPDSMRRRYTVNSSNDAKNVTVEEACTASE